MEEQPTDSLSCYLYRSRDSDRALLSTFKIHSAKTLTGVASSLPAHNVIEPEGNASSFSVFLKIGKTGDEAREKLKEAGIRLEQARLSCLTA